MASSRVNPSYVEDMLTCPVCLELVTEPRTLAQCFHNYCKTCVQQLMDRQRNDKPGVVCPLCRDFSAEDEIRNNHFVNDLLCQHISCDDSESEKKSRACEQCHKDQTPAEAEWKCLDCRYRLCGTCRDTHLAIPMLRGHRILALTEDIEAVIDRLVFCSTHPDEPIKFYCSQCDEAICNTCHVVKHKAHDIVTVDDALSKMIPQLTDQVKLIQERSCFIEKNIQKLDKNLDEVKKNFSTCRNSIDKEIEERIAKLRKQQKKLKQELTEEEEKQISLIQDKKASLSGRQQTLTHLKNVTTTSLERARHASLLTELVSGGLCRKLKEVTSTSTQSETVCVKKPELKRTAAHVSEKSESVGEIVYRTENMSVKYGVNKKTRIRHFTGNYKEVFKKTLKQTLEIKLTNLCKKVSVFDDKVWVPLFNNKVVNVYTVSGELVNTFRTQGCPVSVEKTATGEIMVSCYNTGLYVLNKDTNNTVQISAGDYCDMCVCGESVYTWDYRKKCVEKFVKDDTGTWRQNRVVSVTWVQNRHIWDTLLVREGEDDTSVEFFIGVCYQHTVFQVNSQGDKVRQFGGQNEQGDGGLKCPCVCGVDNHGHVLVADRRHNQYKLLDTHTGHWSVVFTGESEVDDAKITGNTIWFSRHTNSRHVITKHEISM